MKIVVDNQIVKMLAQDCTKIVENPILCNLDNHISFGWPSLLEYLGLGSIFSTLPAFDETQPLFVACISTLHVTEEKEVLCHVYDRLFAENLTQIKALPQINASFLPQAIKEKREKSSSTAIEKVLSPALAAIEAFLADNASHTMHDLILYLAWDRMCVSMSRLFNYQSADPKFNQGIDVLKDCLIESFQHISQQGRTVPSFYRMLEALFFFQLREENIPKHTDEEWTLLSQSFPVLKEQNELADFIYIDHAVISEEELKTEEADSEVYLTLDSPEAVHSRLALANFMMNKLKSEVPGWDYVLHPKKIVYLNLD